MSARGFAPPLIISLRRSFPPFLKNQNQFLLLGTRVRSPETMFESRSRNSLTRWIIANYSNRRNRTAVRVARCCYFLPFLEVK